MNRRFFFSAVLMTFSFFAAAQIPEKLQGIWQSDDRYIWFGEEDETAIILKEYYGWYLDRAVEPENFTEIHPRYRNLATQKKGFEYTASFTQFRDIDNAWELVLTEDDKNHFVIPAALDEDKIYLNFLIKIPEMDEDSTDDAEKSFYGYWQGINNSQAIRISYRNNTPNLYSWFITEDGNYRLRFWQTDMSLNGEATAEFTDGDKLFQVNKHILSGGQVYTCATGRSGRIRNVEKFKNFVNDYKINDDYTIIFLGKPYLTKLTDRKTADELMKIVQEQNSRKKPVHPPFFPVKEPEISE